VGNLLERRSLRPSFPAGALGSAGPAAAGWGALAAPELPHGGGQKGEEQFCPRQRTSLQFLVPHRLVVCVKERVYSGRYLGFASFKTASFGFAYCGLFHRDNQKHPPCVDEVCQHGWCFGLAKTWHHTVPAFMRTVGFCWTLSSDGLLQGPVIGWFSPELCDMQLSKRAAPSRIIPTCGCKNSSEEHEAPLDFESAIPFCVNLNFSMEEKRTNCIAFGPSGINRFRGCPCVQLVEQMKKRLATSVEEEASRRNFQAEVARREDKVSPPCPRILSSFGRKLGMRLDQLQSNWRICCQSKLVNNHSVAPLSCSLGWQLSGIG
jgi:hypothetical protein